MGHLIFGPWSPRSRSEVTTKLDGPDIHFYANGRWFLTVKEIEGGVFLVRALSLTNPDIEAALAQLDYPVVLTLSRAVESRLRLIGYQTTWKKGHAVRWEKVPQKSQKGPAPRQLHLVPAE
jgi:hypothetical protein